MKPTEAHYGSIVAIQKIAERSEEWIAADASCRYEITLANGKFRHVTRFPHEGGTFNHGDEETSIVPLAWKITQGIDENHVASALRKMRKCFKLRGVRVFRTPLFERGALKPMTIQVPYDAHLSRGSSIFTVHQQHLGWEPYQRWQQDLLLSALMERNDYWKDIIWKTLTPTYAQLGIELGIFFAGTNTSARVSILDKYPSARVFY